MDRLEIGPGPICKCCHDDAQGIVDGLCQSCRGYSAALMAEVERLKDAWESAELRADDGWLEVERLRKDLQLSFEERDEARGEVERLKRIICQRVECHCDDYY